MSQHANHITTNLIHFIEDWSVIDSIKSPEEQYITLLRRDLKRVLEKNEYVHTSPSPLAITKKSGAMPYFLTRYQQTSQSFGISLSYEDDQDIEIEELEIQYQDLPLLGKHLQYIVATKIDNLLEGGHAYTERMLREVLFEEMRLATPHPSIKIQHDFCDPAFAKRLYEYSRTLDQLHGGHNYTNYVERKRVFHTLRKVEKELEHIKQSTAVLRHAEPLIVENLQKLAKTCNPILQPSGIFVYLPLGETDMTYEDIMMSCVGVHDVSALVKYFSKFGTNLNDEEQANLADLASDLIHEYIHLDEPSSEDLSELVVLYDFINTDLLDAIEQNLFYFLLFSQEDEQYHDPQYLDRIDYHILPFHHLLNEPYLYHKVVSFIRILKKGKHQKTLDSLASYIEHTQQMLLENTLEHNTQSGLPLPTREQLDRLTLELHTAQ